MLGHSYTDKPGKSGETLVSDGKSSELRYRPYNTATMPSTLYMQAKGEISRRDPAMAGQFEAFEQWLSNSEHVSVPKHSTGERLLDNLRQEAHLCGESGYGDHSELAAFMEDCALLFGRAASEEERVQMFARSCEKYYRRGLRIPLAVLPPLLERYVSHRKAIELLLNRTAGPVAATQFRMEQISIIVAEKLIQENWAYSRFRDEDKLARDVMVFAAPVRGKWPDNTDALAIAESFGLPIAFGDGVERFHNLVRYEYDTHAVSNHRFPTFADAGRFPGFLPAPETCPDPKSPDTCWGWTKPLGRNEKRPEIIHDNASLRVLKSPIRYVGSFKK